MLHLVLLAGSALLLGANAASCGTPRLSCSDADTSSPDPCCQPHPGGLFVFKQRFDPDIGDAGAWGIEGLDVLACDGSPVTQPTTAPPYSHEEIASFCLKSSIIGGEEGFTRAEKEWAQSEVGEGVEEVWERSWNTAGRLISTLGPQCGVKAGAEAVPLFFDALHRLHARYNTAKLLADADLSVQITPSADTTYSLSEIINALSLVIDAPHVTCDNVTLSTVYWPLEVKGTFQSGTFEPYTKLTTASSCPAEGIILPPSQAPMPKKEDPPRDPLDRPLLRPITKSADMDRLYWKPTDAAVRRDDPKKLGFFKDKDRGREGKGGDKQYGRDEL